MNREFLKPALLSFALLLLFFTACRKEMYSSAWQSSPVNADGKLSEWELPLRFYDANSKLNYAITNDSERLYISVMISDEQMQLKMLRAGFEVLIDTTGKKTGNTTISYPLAKEKTPGQTTSSTDTPHTPHSGNRNVYLLHSLQQQQFMQLSGFKNNTPELSALHNDNSINVGVTLDTSANVMYYEAAIPFKIFFKEKLSASDTLKKWNIGLLIHALPAPAGTYSNGGMHGGGGAGGMGAGGMSGGGMRGGGGGGGGMHAGEGAGSADRSAMFETTQVWTSIRLGLKQK